MPFVIVMLPHKAEHEEASGLLTRASALRPFPALMPAELTLSMPHPTVAKIQKTPDNMLPRAKEAIVLIIPAEPVLGMPIKL